MTLITFKRHAGIALVAFIFFTCTSCARTYVFPHAEPVKTTWNVAVEFDSTIQVETREGIQRELDRLIANSSTKNSRFVRASDTSRLDMKISVSGYRPVKRRAQIWGGVGILFGIASVGIGFGFIVIPQSTTVAQVYVYDGENNTHIRRKTQAVFGEGFLKKEKKQLTLHPEGYREFFGTMLRWYEKDLATARRKKIK